jgi:hypothetical protein
VGAAARRAWNATLRKRLEHLIEPGQATSTGANFFAGTSSHFEPLHLDLEFEAQLPGLVIRQPIGHLGKHGLVETERALDPGHRLRGPRLSQKLGRHDTCSSESSTACRPKRLQIGNSYCVETIQP